METAGIAPKRPGHGPHRARHARHAHRIVLVATLFLLAFLARSLASAVPTSAPGERRCVEAKTASSTDYLIGRVCPPKGFAGALGYEPSLIRTPYGWRYTKPAWAGGACSGPLTDSGPFWDFTAACRTHDYGYDLVRFGVADRPAVDRLLYRDMKASCLTIGLVQRGGCKVLADTANAVLTVGDVTGFDVRPLDPSPPPDRWLAP